MSDETMSVLPRILDPSMKFTINSIKQMPSKEEVNFKHGDLPKEEAKNIKETTTEDTTENTTKPIQENGSNFYLFFSNYKYVILTIIIVILIIILGFLIYKYFNSKKKNAEKLDKCDKQEDKADLDNNVKQKIDNYISGYIIDDDNIETNSETGSESEPENDTTEVEYSNTIEELDTTDMNPISNNQAQNNNKFGILIQETIAIDPNIQIDTNLQSNRFEEIDNLETHSLSDILEDDGKSVDNNSETNYSDGNKSETNESINLDDDKSETNDSVDFNDIINELNNTKKEKSKSKTTKKKKSVEKDIDHFKAYINKN